MWQRFTIAFGVTVGGLLAAIAALLLVTDPYGVSPLGPRQPRPIMDTNQRFLYPQLVRYGDHDSLVIGTSTSRLLEPERLDAAFGGRFANLALSDGRAWEQAQLFDLFVRVKGPPRTLWVGLDTVWCDPGADRSRTTDRGFPDWLYDDVGWRDLMRLFNFKTVEIAGRHLGALLGMQAPRFDADGFGDFTPGEAHYDAARAAWHIWRGAPQRIEPVEPAVELSEADRAALRFPALAWLDGMLARLQGQTRVLLVFMPVHVAAQPRPGSDGAAREAECKRRVADIAGRHGAHYGDFRGPSAVTTNDANYWDGLHWRIGVGRELIEALRGETMTGARR